MQHGKVMVKNEDVAAFMNEVKPTKADIGLGNKDYTCFTFENIKDYEKAKEWVTSRKDPLHQYWDYMSEAMLAISHAAGVAFDNEEVIEHLKEYGCYEETYDPVFWVTDYIEKMFEE